MAAWFVPPIIGLWGSQRVLPQAVVGMQQMQCKKNKCTSPSPPAPARAIAVPSCLESCSPRLPFLLALIPGWRRYNRKSVSKMHKSASNKQMYRRLLYWNCCTTQVLAYAASKVILMLTKQRSPELRIGISVAMLSPLCWVWLAPPRF